MCTLRLRRSKGADVIMFRLIKLCCFTGVTVTERVSHSLTDKIMYKAALLKADFMFGRMHIHIHITGINGQVNHERRLFQHTPHTFISLTDCVQDEFVPHTPAVYKTELAVGTAS